MRAQFRINEAHTLEELRPIDRGHEAHACNDIADSDAHRALELMLFGDNLLRARSLCCQSYIQPVKCGCYCRILISQSLDNLHRKCRRKWLSIKSSKSYIG